MATSVRVRVVDASALDALFETGMVRLPRTHAGTTVGAQVRIQLYGPVGALIEVDGEVDRVDDDGVTVRLLITETERTVVDVLRPTQLAAGTGELPTDARVLAASAPDSAADELTPKSYARYLNLVARLCGNGEYEAARAVLNAALADAPDNKTLCVQLAIVCARIALARDDDAAAVSHLREALELDPSCTWARDRLKQLQR